jgi:DNA-binding protein HU-beta
MSKNTKMPKASCKKALEAFVKAVSAALKGSKVVTITGFGTFTTVKRKKRTGINPATGKKMDIPAKTVPKFRPGKALRDAVGA